MEQFVPEHYRWYKFKVDDQGKFVPGVAYIYVLYAIQTHHSKTMNTKCFVLILLTISFSQSYGQDKKDLKISLSAGLFNSSYYTNSKPRQFYNFGFDYSITKRHIISTDFISGQHQYYDSIRVTTPIPLTTPGYEKHTNAEARTTVFSVLYKYKLLDKTKFSVNVGTGLGIITKTLTYPVDIPNGGFTFETSGGKGDLCFPLRLDMDYQILKNFQSGIIAGIYVYPDYPLVGEHLGIRISYIVR